MARPETKGGPRFVLMVLTIALLCCAGLLLTDWLRIAAMSFRDTDDALRYVEIHAFLSGQSWFDVSQHRINPPFGGWMHWSRLLDLPFAGLMLLLRPWLGIDGADKAAMTIVPLALTVALFLMSAIAFRRFAGEKVALVAALLLAVSLSVLIQFHPLRIDHHDWQILLAAVALWAAFDPEPRRGGLIAGAALAFWMHISIEGLPYAVLFAGLFALYVLRRASEWPRLFAFMTMLALGSALFLLTVRGWPAARVAWCDAMSPVYLWPLATVAVAMPLLSHLLGEHSVPRRFLVLALSAGIGGGVFFLFSGRHCLGGPFEALDPVVYDQWYVHVMEGRPIWEQPLSIGVVVAAPALLGFIGYFLAIRDAATPARCLAWIDAALLALGATLVAIWVMRAMAVAHLFLLPGNAFLLMRLWDRARRVASAPMRVVASVLVILATPPGIEAVFLAAVPANAQARENLLDIRKAQCVDRDRLRALAALPEGTIFAPLDISPFLLAFTPHSVIATGHHRNNLPMKEVILGFSSAAPRARPVVLGSRAAYLAYCPGWGEVDRYATLHPRTLIGDLDSGRIPAWLRPVPMPDSGGIRVYRVVRGPGTKVSATPFMQ